MFDEKQLLIRLLKHFYISNWDPSLQNDGFTWSYKEDISLAEIDPDLNRDLKTFVKECSI